MICKNCGNEETNESKFCSVCGSVIEIETEEKTIDEYEAVCGGCGYLFEDEKQMFCPKCGKKRKMILKNCPFCNAPVLNQDDAFCSVCGKKYEQQSIAEKVKDNEFVKSVGDDLKNSQSIQKLKNSVDKGINKINTANKTTKKKIIIAASIIIPFIILIVIICNVHVCDDCGEKYFGSRNEITMWGETGYFCDDCYEDYWY